LIQEVQHHPYEDTVLHIDFHEVLATEKLRTRVPVRPVGEPAGVKNGGGVLEYVMRELHVECLPQDLPDVIEVNVEKLEIGQSIHIGDIARRRRAWRCSTTRGRRCSSWPRRSRKRNWRR
jgi:large subunit ribosomal protein L25